MVYALLYYHTVFCSTRTSFCSQPQMNFLILNNGEDDAARTVCVSVCLSNYLLYVLAG